MRLLPYFCLVLLCTTLNGQSITGDWYATLNAMGTRLPLIIHIEEANGTYSGTLDSPSQNAYGIAMDEVSYTGNQFFFSIAQLGAAFKGTNSALGLIGDFSQAGFDFNLEFGRTPPAANGNPRRAQEPLDYPYKREVVNFLGGAPGVKITGELTSPTTGKIKQVVILVSGSGGQDRNSELGEAINHRPFLVLSDYLTRQGIAVLRCDDRGIGESTGDFNQATTADFAQDVSQAVTYLKSRPELKKAQVGIIGHSEGGIIAPMLAAERDDIDFLVLLGAPGIPSDTLMLTQSRLIQSSMGAPPVLIERNLKPVRKAYTFIKGHPALSEDEITEGLIDIFKASITDLPAPLQTAIGDHEQFARQQVGGLGNIWFRYFLSIDPAPYLQSVTVPVLALNGELDLQVPATINLNGIAKHVGSNGNKEITIVPMPGLNHLFQTATTGSPNEYGQIEETFNPAALRIIADWIQKR